MKRNVGFVVAGSIAFYLLVYNCYPLLTLLTHPFSSMLLALLALQPQLEKDWRRWRATVVYCFGGEQERQRNDARVRCRCCFLSLLFDIGSSFRNPNPFDRSFSFRSLAFLLPLFSAPTFFFPSFE